MEIESNNDIHKSQILEIFDLFKSILKPLLEEDPQFTVKVTSDIKKDIHALSSMKERRYFDKSGIIDFNGYLVQPKTECLIFTLLIAERQFENDQYIHTFFHELVHLYDYYQFFKETGNLNIRDDKEKEEKYYWEFYSWSEFHAKKLGILLYAIYEWHKTNGPDPPMNGRYEFEIDFQTVRLINIITQFTENKCPASANDLFWNAFHELIAYYGRLSVFHMEGQNSFPDSIFPKDLLTNTFGEEVIDVYYLLQKMDSYQNAITRLKEFRELKAKIISRINRDRNVIPIFLGDILKQYSFLEQKMIDLKRLSLSEPSKLNIPKIQTVWEEIIPLLKNISKNTEEIKNLLNEIKNHLEKK